MAFTVNLKPHLTYTLEQMKGNSVINFTSGTYKLALFKPAAAININTSTTYSTTNEVTGGGYTAGGQTVNSVSVVSDNGDTNIEVRGDAVVWAQNGSGFSDARYAVLYATANNRIIASADFGGNISNVTFPIGIGPISNEYVKLTRSAS